MMKRLVLTALLMSAPVVYARPLQAAESSASKTTAVPHANLNMNALHRLDFVVTGTSCPACLLKMQKRIDIAAGVAKAAVMLRKPYGGVVIYDSTKTGKDKVFTVLKGDEKKVDFQKVEDAPIDKMPIILVPHHSFDK